MMKGKLIVVEGTDCSGKETQTNLLMQKFSELGMRVEKFSFPNYQSPTGKIIGGPYLGKSYIGDSWFKEGAPKVDPKVAALYYAADRKYNIYKITFLLENGVNVILDRYVYSNMAHQGGKISDSKEREDLYNWLETLEFDLLELPHADIKIFLHMPYEQAAILKQNREEKGYPLRMSYQNVVDTAQIIPSDFFIVKNDGCPVFFPRCPGGGAL